MIGIKSIAAVLVAVVLVTIGATRHVLSLDYLAHLSPAACFAIGLVACLAVALIGVGWRFGSPSRVAVRLGGRPALVENPAAPRELPGALQRLLVLAGFASVTLAAVGNHAAARIVQLPAELTAPSPAGYCMPKPVSAEPVVAPPSQPAEQPGCALVKRAFQLGYTKSLGACAPKEATPAALAPLATQEVCTRRQLDEPLLHYGYRRVAAALSSATAVAPIAAVEHRVDDVRTHIEYLDGLVADIRHAITGSPHAAHHLWVNLPDPHPGSIADRFLGAPRCSRRFADLPLWPSFSGPSALVEHVLGQLLFATRFGTTASCSDYTIHWNASADVCKQLAADPVGTLGREGALASVRAVLDRRTRQLEVGELATRLGRRPPVAPPAPTAIASLACFLIGPAAPSVAQTVTVDGSSLALREIRIAAIRTDGDGPIDVYLALATLLGGSPPPAKPTDATLIADPAHPLLALDPLVELDPFAGARAPLQRPELRDVYPFEHHLHAFIDAFRRQYLAQRGRL